ncbi:hypothetical protein JCM21900_002377, partial [Sporobolomyces salmonicolor]
ILASSSHRRIRFADFKALAMGKTSTGDGTVIGADATGALPTSLVSPLSAPGPAAAALAVIIPDQPDSFGAAVFVLLYIQVDPLLIS